jgi:putative N6-adenine-specific DNA methylase
VPTDLLSCFAATAPGLEPILVGELEALGLGAGIVEAGGVAFEADPAGLLDALIGLRTASRVSLRLASFRARTFPELERHATAVDWSRVLSPGGRVHCRVTSKKSRLYHEGAIAERLERAAQQAVAGLEPVRSAGQAEALEDDVLRLPGVQRIIVRVHRDVVTLSADASGGALHRRGYRQATAKAPLRETLAAAMLLSCGWRPDEPLVDPMCGAGTIAIEAAMIARRIAPGTARRFAAEAWVLLPPALVTAARERAAAGVLPASPASIVAHDRDAGAVAATLANAERAGVAAGLACSESPLSALAHDPGRGWIVTNPPYGVRVGEVDRLRSLYAALGTVLVTRRPAWSLAMLSANPKLAGQVGVGFEERWRTSNGGIDVALLVASSS